MDSLGTFFYLQADPSQWFLNLRCIPVSLVYPKHHIKEKCENEPPMKHGVKIVLKALDLSKKSMDEIQNECASFAREATITIRDDVMSKMVLAN